MSRSNPQLAAAKRKAGDQKMEAAEKCLQTGLFKWKPDYEGASSEFQQAAIAYTNANLKDLAINAHKKAATCYTQMKLEFSVAKHLEKAGDLSMDLNKYAEAAQLYETAAQSLISSESNEKAANCYTKASAACAKAGDVKKAISTMESALNAFEVDDKEYLSVDHYFTLSGFYISLSQWDEVLKVLDRLVQIYKKLEQPHNRYRCYLYYVIILINTKTPGKEIFDALGKFSSDEDFMQSPEYSLASSILGNVMSDDEQAWQNLLKSKIHMVRHAEFGKLLLKTRLLGASAHPFHNLLPEPDQDPVTLDEYDEFGTCHPVEDQNPPQGNATVVEDDDLL